jgi:hypothetical protein
MFSTLFCYGGVYMLKPEEIEDCRRIYDEKKETIEHWLKYGNDFEKAIASTIKKIVLGEIE